MSFITDQQRAVLEEFCKKVAPFDMVNGYHLHSAIGGTTPNVDFVSAFNEAVATTIQKTVKEIEGRMEEAVREAFFDGVAQGEEDYAGDNFDPKEYIADITKSIASENV